MDRVLPLHTKPEHDDLMALWNARKITIAEFIDGGERIWQGEARLFF